MKHKEPPTLLFDANPMVISGKSGVGYFTNRLIAALSAEYPNDLHLIGHYFNFLGRKKNPDLVYAPNITYRQSRIIPGKVFNGLRRKLHLEIPLEALARQKADVLLFPNFAILPSLFNTPRIVVIHDLYFTVRPDHINRNNIDFLQKFVPSSAAKADLIITISEFTKQAIIDTYGIPAEKILTISIPPPPTTTLSQNQTRGILQIMHIQKPYILYIGNIEPRKNLVALIRGYKALPKKLRDTYSLVLAGGKGWNDEDIQREILEAREAGLDIITTGYVSVEQRSALYLAAEAFALSSHYEGFGMQILEAMSYHIPTAISNIPVFHEVAHDAAVYFDQNDPHDISMKLQALLTNPALRRSVVQKADKVVREYTWDDVARTVFARISELTNG